MSQIVQSPTEHFKKFELCPKAMENDKTVIRKKEKGEGFFENTTSVFGDINNWKNGGHIIVHSKLRFSSLNVIYSQDLAFVISKHPHVYTDKFRLS